MSLLFKVLFVSACKNTHHKLVLDSLRFLRGPHGENWRNLFVKHHILLLSGAKAPDDQFKDFKNHVLHVRENFWGGAVSAAKSWYQRTVDALANQSWLEAIYAAGVLSHYVTDPFMPLHTGQSEAEGKVHRAAEWSVACCYSELQQIIETDLGGYPAVNLSEGDDWLGRLIREGATAANEHYEAVLDHYNLAFGVKDPPAGLDQELKDRLAKQIGLAVVSFARVLDRAIADSRTTPPDVFVTLEGLLSTLQMPAHWIVKKLRDMKERAVVEAIFDEVQQTGKAIVTLPEDEQTVRKLHAQEVLHKSQAELDKEKPGPTGSMYGKGAGVRWRLSLPVMYEPRIPAAATPIEGKKAPTPELKTKPASPPSPKPPTRVDSPSAPPAPPAMHAAAPDVAPAESGDSAEPTNDGKPRFFLDRSRPVVDAPAIGHKMARRLEAIDIHTIDDLLQAAAEDVARKLNLPHVDALRVRQWQAATELVCRVPGLRGHDAQLLIASGVTEPEQLGEAKGRELLALIERSCDTPDGERILRGSPRPDLNEVMGWIRAARQARSLQEA